MGVGSVCSGDAGVAESMSILYTGMFYGLTNTTETVFRLVCSVTVVLRRKVTT